MGQLVYFEKPISKDITQLAFYPVEDTSTEVPGHEWHVGYGLTGSPQWVRRAFGRLPQHYMVDLVGYKRIVLNHEEVRQLNPSSPVYDEEFQVYGLSYTANPDDKERVFIWSLNKNEEELVTALNNEVGYTRDYRGVRYNGKWFRVALDAPFVPNLGRDREPTDPLLINGYEASMRVADIFHDSFIAHTSREQEISLGGKERV